MLRVFIYKRFAVRVFTDDLCPAQRPALDQVRRKKKEEKTEEGCAGVCGCAQTA
jgi:hypothetical protein